MIDLLMLGNPSTTIGDSGYSPTWLGFLRDIMGLENPFPTNTSGIIDLIPPEKGWTFLDDSTTTGTDSSLGVDYV
jgi:hypothetical protein